MDTKSFYMSKGFWGSAMVLFAAVAQFFGIDFGADLQAQAAELVVATLTAVSGLIAMIGRVSADKKLTL